MEYAGGLGEEKVVGEASVVRQRLRANARLRRDEVLAIDSR